MVFRKKSSGTDDFQRLENLTCTEACLLRLEFCSLVGAQKYVYWSKSDFHKKGGDMIGWLAQVC